MEFEDFIEPEIAVTTAVVAAIFSPRARQVIRKGLVYGMAGVLTAGDVVTSFARSIGQGVRQVDETETQGIQKTEGRAGTEQKAAETSREGESATYPRSKAASKAEGKSV